MGFMGKFMMVIKRSVMRLMSRGFGLCSNLRPAIASKIQSRDILRFWPLTTATAFEGRDGLEASGTCL